MDLHRLAEERSLAYHRIVARRLEHEPHLLERARARIEQWQKSGTVPYYANEWHKVLSGSLSEICAVLEDTSERASALRQATPFAGALTPVERWKLWRRVREQHVR